MGLDMYLYQDQHFAHIPSLADGNDYYRNQLETAEKLLNALDYPVEGVDSVNVRTTVIYWRKANQIHNWFVKNVQEGNDDCGEYYVTEEQLLELRGICDEVIKSSKLVEGKVYAGTVWSNEFPDGHTKFEDGTVVEDEFVARRLLPTSEGFFFGGTDYDEWYIKDLEHTRDSIDRVLKNLPEHAYLHYSSSW